jgi:hypothetical protein
MCLKQKDNVTLALRVGYIMHGGVVRPWFRRINFNRGKVSVLHLLSCRWPPQSLAVIYTHNVVVVANGADFVLSWVSHKIYSGNVAVGVIIAATSSNVSAGVPMTVHYVWISVLTPAPIIPADVCYDRLQPLRRSRRTSIIDSARSLDRRRILAWVSANNDERHRQTTMVTTRMSTLTSAVIINGGVDRRRLIRTLSVANIRDLVHRHHNRYHRTMLIFHSRLMPAVILTAATTATVTTTPSISVTNGPLLQTWYNNT